MRAPTLVILAGPNGAGKSTIAETLIRETLRVYEFVNADTIARGLSAFAPESVAFAAGRIMLRRLHDLAASRADFAFETTLASRSYLPWLAGMRQSGYRIHLIYLYVNDPGGQDVPIDIIRRRYARSLSNFFSLYRHAVTHWRFYDNSTVNPILLASASPRHKHLETPELWARLEKEHGKPSRTP